MSDPEGPTGADPAPPVTSPARRPLVAGAPVAFGIYLAAALALFGAPLQHGSTDACLCVASTSDAGQTAWTFEWVPHALLHGLNPFYTHLLYAPQGFDVTLGPWLVPAAAVIFAPVTAIAGPLFAFNLAMLLSPVLAAFFAFLLARRLTRDFWPSLVGGWLFGFSTYVLGQLTSHLQSSLVFLVPAIVLLVVGLLTGEVSRRRSVALLVAALVLQFCISDEVFASMTLLGAIALALGYALGDRPARARVRGALGPIVLAYAAAAAIVSPYLYYALQPGGLPILSSRTDRFSTDLLGYVVPTPITRLGGLRFASVSHTFTAGFVEGGAYLGVPLLAMVVLAALRGWRRPQVRTIAITLIVVAILSLGGVLHVDGSSSIALPWAIVNHLPLLGQMLPARFALYAALLAALLAAGWLAASGPRLGRWVLAALAVASLWPAVGRHYWTSTPDLPALFATSAYRHVIGPHDTALLLPVGVGGQSMLWQAEARLSFAMASGYVEAPEQAGPYSHDPIYPTLVYSLPVPDQQRAAASFIASHHVTVAVLDPHGPAAAAWVPMLQQLGWAARAIDGAIVLRPAGIVPEPAQPTPAPPAPRAAGPIAAQLAAARSAGEYYRAFAAAKAARFCALLTPDALAAELQQRGAQPRACAIAMRSFLARNPALRAAAATASIGPVTIDAAHGYVAVTLAPGRLYYLPVHELGGRWLIDGIPAPSP